MARTLTHMRKDTFTVTGCNLPGAYGWPSIPLHLSYTQTTQIQFTLPDRDRESETNFPRTVDSRTRNHPMTETLRGQPRER